MNTDEAAEILLKEPSDRTGVTTRVPTNISKNSVFLVDTATPSIPCEQKLHSRGMSWRAKSSLCRQPFNFLSCMRKIRHAIRKQLVRQICVSFAGKLPANYSPRASVLFFCFAPSGFNYFSRKISTDRLF